MTRWKMSLLAILTIAGSSASAQEDRGWYLGANVGQSRAKIDDDKINNTLFGAGFTGVTLDDRDRSTGYKLFVGYQFNRYFALEGGYFDLGTFGFTANTLPVGTLDGQAKVNGVHFDLVASLPLTRKFSVFGRAGVISADVKDTFQGTGAMVVYSPDVNKRETHYKFGGGLQYDFTRSFGMRAEAERYRINDALSNRGDVDLFSVGVLFRFGRHAATPAPEPAPVAVAPPPAPVERVVVVVPVAAQTQKYCTILDLQFEIDNDEIQKDDLEKLAVVGTFMTKYPITTAVIEGHTDNVGSDEHNMALSLRRAQSVVAYLVDKVHIQPSRLQAVGYGNTRPIADNATEEGKRQNRRIGAVIACAEDIEGLTVAPARITMAMLIEYDRNAATIKPEYRPELAKLAAFLKANPTVTATVEGHTGNLQGTPERAMSVSLERAQNVVEALVTDYGIDRSRLKAEGFGQGRRFAYNTSLEGQQENRRVNIMITYPRK
jgi:OOP family OmpA-OmpF porin